MAEDENSWVFDSLVCFLNGPIWDAPIQSFIEEKSLIFEPNNEEDEEDYSKIYDEYKNLVDFMLGNFMEDIGITPAQFEFACQKGHEHKHSVRFDQNIFEQIWAANNYEMFKRMMTQRNVELQLQALELIEQKYGFMPKSFIPIKKNEPEKLAVDIEQKGNIEKAILSEVAKKFPEEEPPNAPEMQFLLEEKQILETTREKMCSELAKTGDELTTEKFEKRELEENKVSEQHNKDKLEISSGIKPIEIKSEPQTEKKISEETVKNELKDVKVSVSKEIDQIELKKRQEYLRMQRDKLVALKKEERKKQFGKADEIVGKKLRPKSAKAAEAVLTGEKSTIPSQELQLRRALAERLKSEVVDKTKK